MPDGNISSPQRLMMIPGVSDLLIVIAFLHELNTVYHWSTYFDFNGYLNEFTIRIYDKFVSLDPPLVDFTYKWEDGKWIHMGTNRQFNRERLIKYCAKLKTTGWVNKPLIIDRLIKTGL